MAKRNESPSEPVKVVIADLTPLNCELLMFALERNARLISVSACATDSPSVLRELDQHRPTVALIGANLQDGALVGLELVREIRSRYPDTAAVILLDGHDRSQVVQAFRAGAKGIFVRSGTVANLINCILAVHNGQIWAASHELHYLVEELAQPNEFRVVNSKGEILLTAREEEIVSGVAEGLSNRAIAEQLRLSAHTVKNYLFRIYDKLGVSNRAELILYAMNHRKASAKRSQAA